MGGHHHHNTGGRKSESHLAEEKCRRPKAEAGGKNPFSEFIFEYRQVETGKLILVLVITTLAMLIEIAGGFLTGSLSLLSDAGHMFTHSFAIIISLLAILIARNPPCHHRTYGLFRAEILAAFVNSLFLFAVTFMIVYESIRRLLSPVDVLGMEMLAVAVFGLVINLVTMLILHGHRHGDLNVKSVFLHLLADTLSSVAIVIGAAVIHFSGLNLIDPVISLGISIAIAVWAWGLFRESSRILLEMSPRGIDVDSLGTELKSIFPEIERLENVHFWAITSDMYVFTAHMKISVEAASVSSENELISRINSHLRERYNIIESTIQRIY